MKVKSNLGIALVLVSAIGFGAKPIFTKFIYQFNVDPYSLIVIRNMMVSILMASTLFITKGKSGFRLSKSMFYFIVKISIFGILLSYICSYYSIYLLDASVSTLIIFTYPSFTLFFLARYGKKIEFVKLVSVAITFIGLMLLLEVFSVEASEVSTLGIALALITAISFAYYNANSQKILKEVEPLSFTTISCLICTLLLSPSIYFVEFNLPLMAWFWIFMLAFTSGFIAMLCFYIGIKKIGADKAVIINSLGPAFTVLLSFEFLNETFSIMQLVGMVIIFIGVISMKVNWSTKAKP